MSDVTERLAIELAEELRSAELRADQAEYELRAAEKYTGRPKTNYAFQKGRTPLQMQMATRPTRLRTRTIWRRQSTPSVEVVQITTASGCTSLHGPLH